MGTRHLVCAVQGGQFKLAQYGQWDGYPSGQGVSILAFLKGPDFPVFKKNLPKCHFGSDAEFSAINKKAKSAGGIRKTDFRYLSRDTSSDILGVIANSPQGLILQDSSSFAADGLMCEWVYVIDLDAEEFEIYDGFHKEPAPAGERFAGVPRPENQTKIASEYSSVHLVKAYFLADLPDEDRFLTDLDREES